MIKILSRVLLVVYVVILLWLVLFKWKFNISSIVNRRHRSLNLIPFAAPSKVNGRIIYDEILYNCLFFIPFGLLLNANFKKVRFLPKLVFIMLFSIAVELIQFIFAIGATDITDVITNTFGGFVGLTLYNLCNRYINSERLDSVIIAFGTVFLVIFIAIRHHITLK
jgi:glycopeptide antibiotics resistance protein